MLRSDNSQLTEELFAIEDGFWTKGREHFLEHVDEECLLAFPQMGEMHGVKSREEIAATATMPNRWRDLKIASRHLHEPGDDIAIIRGNVAPYLR